jgi:hypothetical protein
MQASEFWVLNIHGWQPLTWYRGSPQVLTLSLIILSLRRLGKASANHKISGTTENRGGSFSQNI